MIDKEKNKGEEIKRLKKQIKELEKSKTERRQAEEELWKSYKQWETTFDAMNDSIFLLDMNGKILKCNYSAVCLLGKSYKEIIGNHCWQLIHGTSSPIEGCPIIRMKQTLERESMYLPLGNKWFEVIVNPILDSTKKLFGAVHIIKDITEHKQAEEKIYKANRLYATLSQVNQVIVREQDKQKLFQEICNIAIEYGKFRLAWIGLVDEENKLVEPVAFSGEGSDYLQNIKISMTDELTGKGPTCRAIREGKSVVFNDLENNPDYKPWRKQALEKGYRSSAAFPIRIYNYVIGALNIYAVEPDFFDKDEIKLLEETTLDISFALEKFKEENIRNHVEEMLEKSESHYRALFNESPVPLWEEDFSEAKKFIDSLKKRRVKDFRKYFDDRPEKVAECVQTIKILEINKPVLKLHEAESKEELLEGLPSIFSEESYEAFKEELIAIAEDRSECEFDAVVKTLKGNEKYIHLKWAVVPSYEESMERVYISTTDITESKKAEEALRKSEALLTETGRMAKVGGWEVDTKTFEVSWTEEIYRIHEVPLGHKPLLQEVINYFHPDDRPKLETAIQKALEHGEPYDMEIRFITAKGKHLWTHAICKPIIVDGKTVKLTGTFQDITERKKTEEALRESESRLNIIFESAPDAYYLNDFEGIFIDGNMAAEELLGYSKEELIGKNFLDAGILSMDQAEKALNMLAENIKGKSAGPDEFILKRKDGTK
ncbi:MAG: PAS domain S-box protein, partial [Candidatus Aminicenantes bacterium]|nr:PAS domain S-box protein [Candidatus Aminicenantes bacterium]